MSTTASYDITGLRAYLAHELRDDAVKSGALVAKTLLAGAQSTEVLCVDIEILIYEKENVYILLLLLSSSFIRNQFNMEKCLPAVLGTTSALSYLNRRGKIRNRN